MTDLSMDVGEYERGVRQSINQLWEMVETTPEAIDIVDLDDLQNDLIALSRIVGHVSEERKLRPYREASARAREAA